MSWNHTGTKAVMQVRVVTFIVRLQKAPVSVDSVKQYDTLLHS